MLPGQHRVWTALDSKLYDVVGWVAGVGTGKTRFAAWRCAHECMSYPSNLGIVAAASAPQLKISTIKKFLDEFDLLGLKFEYSEWKGTVTFENKSWFRFQSLDLPPAQLKGSELGFVTIDEADACGEEAVQNLIQRVRLPNTGRTRLIIGNSPAPGHWLEDAFINKPDPNWKLFCSSTLENHHLAPDYLRTLMKMYPPGTAKHARYILGKMGVAIDGAIYPEFDVARHVITVSEFEKIKPLGYVNGLDLGHNHPTAFLVAALDDDDVLYIISEHYAARTPLSVHAQKIQGMYRGGPIFSDHDAQDRLELKQFGVKTVPAMKQVEIGIDFVRSRLASDRLKIVGSACPNLVREIGSYRWAADEKPMKINDDACDSLRYLVSGLDSVTVRSAALQNAVYNSLRGW